MTIIACYLVSLMYLPLLISVAQPCCFHNVEKQQSYTVETTNGTNTGRDQIIQINRHSRTVQNMLNNSDYVPCK
jgi:hypothetical protein